MFNPLDKIIDLIKKTGDNCIVLDDQGYPVYVVLSFKSYQNLIDSRTDIAGLTEDQLLDKINHDIALWKSSTDEYNLANLETLEEAVKEVKKSSDDPFISEDSLNLAENEDKSDKTEEKYYFEPID